MNCALCGGMINVYLERHEYSDKHGGHVHTTCYYAVAVAAMSILLNQQEPKTTIPEVTDEATASSYTIGTHCAKCTGLIGIPGTADITELHYCQQCEDEKRYWLQGTIPVTELERVIAEIGVAEQDSAMDMLDHASLNSFDQSSYDAGKADAYRDIYTKLRALLPQPESEATE